MPPAFSDTGNRNFNIAVQLGNWADIQEGTGICFDSSTGFTLPNGATRSPDASWIKLVLECLNRGTKASFAPICPNFVIELRSASDSLSTYKTKWEYMDNGASLGWLIDVNRKVYIYRHSQPPEILDNPELVSGDPEQDLCFGRQKSGN